MNYNICNSLKKPLFRGMFLLTLVMIINLTCRSNPAQAGTKASPESISLNTWYVSDFTAETGADYFTFKTSSRINSKYLIITQILETPEDCEAPVIAAELPKEKGYTGNVKNTYIKLAADSSVTIRFSGWDEYSWGDEPFNNLVDCDHEIITKDTTRIKYQFMVLEVRASSTKGEPITGSYSIEKAQAISLNTWYTGSFGVSIEKDHDESIQYMKFKTSSRTNSKYLVLARALTKDSDVYISTRNTVFDSCLSYNLSSRAYDQCNRGLAKLPANKTVKISANSEWMLYDDPDEDGVPNYDKTFKYSVMIMEAPALPSRGKITSLTKGSQRFTVKFAKRSKTTRYKIAYKQSTSNKWNYLTTTNTSKTIKNLSKGKTYKVMVKAQRKIDGKYHSGQWSPIRSIKL